MPHYEYDKDYPFAAFITNLGKYNEGSLVGEWVKFPTTAEELQKVFERIGIGSKDDFGQPYEEWFITDYDCYVDGLYDKLGEYENLDELNYLASKLDEMSQGEYEQFQAAMEIGDHSGSLQEIINLTENLDCYDVYPDIRDHDDLGRYYIEELDAMQVPEHLRNYIDYEAYGRDVALEEGGGDIRVLHDFFKSFKQNFRQSTLIWILMAAAGIFIYMEKEALATMPGSMSQIFNYVIFAVYIPLVAVALYVFPTVAAFENKTMTLITNAFYFAVKHIGYALAVAVITILPMTMTLVDAKLFPVYLLIWLMFGFSLTAYADSWFMWKLFKPYFKEEEEEHYYVDTEPDQYAF